MRTKNRQLWFILVIVLAGVTLFLTGCNSIPDVAKPDVHLTFDIHRDGSNITTLEVAVHPFVDPLLQPAFDMARRLIGEEAGKSVEITRQLAKDRVQRHRAEVRQHRRSQCLRQHAAVVERHSGRLVSDVTIPVPFAEFKAWHDKQKRPEEYGIHGEIWTLRRRQF